MATRTLTVEIVGDPSKASRAFKRVADDADRSGKRIHGFATITSGGMKRVGVAAGGMAAAGAGAAALLAKSFVSGASDIQESLSKNRVLFGQYAQDINRFSKTSADSFGISRQAALEYTGVFGNLFRATGVARAESARFSVGLTKLAADMASFNNTSIEDALEAIRSGIVGETEPLRRFGVNLSDAQLRTEALRQGLVKTTKDALDPQSKALAAQALIVRQTSAAHGDFARTSGGLANQQRILKARLADAGAELGAKLIPAALTAVKAVNSLFDSSTKGGRAISGVGKAAAAAAEWLKGAWADATRAVRRWIGENREQIDTAIQAFRNLGTAGKYVFNEVLLPVIRAASRLIINNLENMRDVMSGLIRFVTSVFAGRWGEAWGAMKDTVRAALRTIKDVVRDSVVVLGTLALEVGKEIAKGVMKGIGAIGHAIYRKIRAGIAWAGQQVASFVDKANPFSSITGNLGSGDGIGRQILPSMGTPGLGGGSLKGADPDLGPFAAVGARFGLGVTSGIRNTTTISGNPSYHNTGDAIDMAGSTTGMRATAAALYRSAGPRLRELISPFPQYGIKDGRPYRYPANVQAQHSGPNAHVHVAYTGPFGDGIGSTARAARAAGFRGQALINAVAIAGAESRYRDSAKNLVYPDHSIGLWQINQLAHHGRYGSDAALMNPMTNARAAFAVSGGGRNFGPWSTWPTAAKSYLSRARAAVAALSGGGASGAGGGARGAAGSVVPAPKTSVGSAVGRGRGRIRRPAPSLADQNLPSGTDFIDAALAEASLTDDTADDIHATQALVDYYSRDLVNARASGDPRQVVAAAQGLKQATDALKSLDDSLRQADERAQQEAEDRRRHTEAVESLAAEFKRQNDFSDSVLAVTSREAVRALGDVINGQIYGRLGQRNGSAGDGRKVLLT